MALACFYFNCSSIIYHAKRVSLEHAQLSGDHLVEPPHAVVDRLSRVPQRVPDLGGDLTGVDVLVVPQEPVEADDDDDETVIETEAPAEVDNGATSASSAAGKEVDDDSVVAEALEPAATSAELEAEAETAEAQIAETEAVVDGAVEEIAVEATPDDAVAASDDDLVIVGDFASEVAAETEADLPPLAQLEAMGFGDTERNLTLLSKHDNNVARVVAELLS